MFSTLQRVWPLLLGMVFLMVSNGLLLTLLTLRGHALGFDNTDIGIMQSAFPIGSIISCWLTPKLILRVGHIRVFAALASLASTGALVHLITDSILVWSAMRLLVGFCYAGLYVVAESWLNGMADNRSRGTILSSYFVIQTGGMALGQLFLFGSNPEGIVLFIVISILISLSLIPILISVTTSPEIQRPALLGLRALFRLSPMGVAGSFLNGVSQSALYVGLGLYGTSRGLSASQTGTLVAAVTVGGMLLQFPIGRLSDAVDRRWVIIGCAAATVPICASLILQPTASTDLGWTFVLIAVLGGLCLPIYSLCLAHANDYLTSEEIVPAGSTLIMVFYIGLIIGPTLVAAFVDRLGSAGLFHCILIAQVLTTLTGLFRLMKGQDRAEEPGIALAYSASSTTGASRLNPDAEQHHSATPGDRPVP